MLSQSYLELQELCLTVQYYNWLLSAEYVHSFLDHLISEIDSRFNNNEIMIQRMMGLIPSVVAERDAVTNAAVEM